MVVDNASDDGTAAMVAERFPHVEVVPLDSNHGAFARNIGAARLDTPLIAFCDDDSWWRPGALSTAEEIFSRHRRLGLLAARIVVGSEARIDPISAAMRRTACRPELPGPRVHGFLACGIVVRRPAFLAAGGFCERFLIGGEEELLAIDLRLAGWELCYADDVVAVHDPVNGHRPGRSWLSLRNGLWTSWMRMPLRQALRDTARLLSDGRYDRDARKAARGALSGLPWALASRRRVPEWLLRERDAAPRVSGAGRR